MQIGPYIVIRKRLKRRRRVPTQRNQLKYIRHREAARTLVHARLRHFNRFYNFELKKVFIKNHSSRWGSCSSRGNLNFNYRLVLLHPDLADYVVVHELCHLKEFNHSPEFWALVAQTVPNWKVLRRELRLVRM